MKKKQLFVLDIFSLMARSSNYRHSEITEATMPDFVADFMRYPEEIEQARPPRIDKDVFAELVQIEMDAMLAYAKEDARDPYGFRDRVPFLFLTKEEVTALTRKKEEVYRDDPDRPDPHQVVGWRIAEAAERALQRDEEVSLEDLVVGRDKEGRERFYLDGAPYTGIGIDRLPPDLAGSNMTGKGLLLSTTEFVDGYKHGEETEYKYKKEGEKTEQIGLYSQTTFKPRYWKFRIRRFEMGRLVSEKYYHPDGSEREEPLTRRLLRNIAGNDQRVHHEPTDTSSQGGAEGNKSTNPKNSATGLDTGCLLIILAFLAVSFILRAMGALP